jgi:hypothetical protein
MLVPMVLNILMVTISLQWRGTPFVLAFLLILNVLLLYVDRKKLLPLLNIATNIKESPVKGFQWWLTGLLMVLASIPLSFWNLSWAYLLVIAGLFISGYLGRLQTETKLKTA